MARITMLEAYNGAALTPAQASQFEALARTVISDLRRAVDLMSVKVRAYQAGISILLGPVAWSAMNNTAEGILSARGTWNEAINIREANVQKVIDGSLEAGRWLAACKTIADGINQSAAQIKQENSFVFLNERINAVAAQIQRLGQNLEDGLNKAIDWSKYLIPGLLIGGGLIVLFHFNSAARVISLRGGRGGRKLNGYRRRRRR